MNVFPTRLVESVNGMIGRVKVLVARSLSFNATTEHLLEMKDQDGDLIDSVNVGISNVENLNTELTSIRADIPEGIPAYISDPTTIALLEDTANWDIDGVYLGTPITGTFQGQKHINPEYLFEATQDDLWIRMIRG